jgi:hypothetical protein
MTPPASASENRADGAEKLGRVDTRTFSTESVNFAVFAICTHVSSCSNNRRENDTAERTLRANKRHCGSPASQPVGGCFGFLDLIGLETRIFQVASSTNETMLRRTFASLILVNARDRAAPPARR